MNCLYMQMEIDRSWNNFINTKTIRETNKFFVPLNKLKH